MILDVLSKIDRINLSNIKLNCWNFKVIEYNTKLTVFSKNGTLAQLIPV